MQQKRNYAYRTIGFIGTGNMGAALAAAAAKAESESARTAAFFLSNRSRRKAEALAQRMAADSANVSVSSNREIAQSCDLLFLGVKPKNLPELFEEIGPILRERLLSDPEKAFTLVTMAAGVSCDEIRSLAGVDRSGLSCPVIRIMPNTPAAVGAGVIQFCGQGVSEEAFAAFTALLRPAGALIPLPEDLMDAAAAVSGCGPAFVYLFIEAMADGGVACGLPRDMALKFAAETAAGAAKMVLETARHPGELKDAVCSPGGTTIQGVRALEAGGLRSAVTEAVIAAYEKSKKA